jgi:hypothetical protein
MSGALWLVVFLATGLLSVIWWLIADWRREIRQARAAGRVAQAVIAGAGRHNVCEPQAARQTRRMRQ